MDHSTTPAIPDRIRHQHTRRKAPQGHSGQSSNRMQVQSASPEVISSLITSLSIISSPLEELFEHTGANITSQSPSARSNALAHPQHRNSGRSTGGSFGIDYGAYDSPSLREMVAEEQSLDELAATPPVIRTAKPPSGFSPLTAPKSPGPIKTFLRGNSRPSSKGSDMDDSSSIGNVSIEPGTAPIPDLRRRSSSDSWGKKQGRQHKGLMYMPSKERLREKEQEKKRATSGSTGANSTNHTSDQPLFPKFDSDSFMAEHPIGEEPEEGTPSRATFANTGTSKDSPRAVSNVQSDVESGRVIPARDSSLRKSVPSSKKRATQRSSRSSGNQKMGAGEPILETDEHDQDRRRNKSDQKSTSKEARSKLNEDLQMPGPRIAEPTSKESRDEPHPVDHAGREEEEDGAPFPAVAQRKDRHSTEASQKRKPGKNTPEPIRPLQPTRNGSRLKRLSAPLSPRADKDSSQFGTAQLSGIASPEPRRSSQIHLDERPNSLDSIDEAVEAYLCSPRLSQKIKHPQTGRTISFSEVGDSEGYAVFCCVGMGLTRYITAFYDELALTLKLRLITPDRPGVGDSEPYMDGTATPLSWPDDVYAICQALKITKFSILAHSAGAIYALATALRMPQHIRGRIHLLAPWIPPSQMNVIGGQVALPPANSLPTSQRILRALPTPFLKAANTSFMSATSSSITSSLPKQKRVKRKAAAARETPVPSGRNTVTPGLDKENHGRNSAVYPDPSDPANAEHDLKAVPELSPEDAVLVAAANTIADKERQVTYDSRLTHAIWDLATQGANPAVDLLVCLERRHTIGFRYVDITRAVVIHHGSKDSRVPVENVRWLGKTMKRCEVRVLEGEGHGLMASASVMGGVLMEIAREWDDWVKVTGGASAAANSSRRAPREKHSIGAFR